VLFELHGNSGAVRQNFRAREVAFEKSAGRKRFRQANNLRSQSKENPTISTKAKAFSTGTVDNFVDYSRRCRPKQPAVRVSANCPGKRHEKRFKIHLFHRNAISLN
jgi:hypothetical protein